MWTHLSIRSSIQHQNGTNPITSANVQICLSINLVYILYSILCSSLLLSFYSAVTNNTAAVPYWPDSLCNSQFNPARISICSFLCKMRSMMITSGENSYTCRHIAYVVHFPHISRFDCDISFFIHLIYTLWSVYSFFGI